MVRVVWYYSCHARHDFQTTMHLCLFPFRIRPNRHLDRFFPATLTVITADLTPCHHSHYRRRRTAAARGLKSRPTAIFFAAVATTVHSMRRILHFLAAFYIFILRQSINFERLFLSNCVCEIGFSCPAWRVCATSPPGAGGARSSVYPR